MNDEKVIPNPTGKGGFGDNPENINQGGKWNPRDSVTKGAVWTR